ncbi:hypothetical protein MMC25_003882 [Agyrium rufum]|nr:hypothetical protein [Agyrium rufum]
MSEALCGQNQGITPLVVTWVLLSIGLIVTSLRVYCRLHLYKNAGWDDYTAVLALAVGILAGGFFTKMITSGMGKHVSCLPAESVVGMLEFSAISEAINVIGIGIIKVSVCLCLLRIIDKARRKMAIFLWCLLVFIAWTHFALAMIFFLHCRPLAALWNDDVHGSCYSTHTTVLSGYVGFAIDVITDLICAGIPIIVIRQLQMNLRTKIALCVVMGLGVCTAGFAIVKALTLKGVFANDYTWGFTQPAFWAAVEQFTGIIVVSLPPLRPLLGSFFSATMTRTHSRYGRRLSNTFENKFLQKIRSWRSSHSPSRGNQPGASRGSDDSQQTYVASPIADMTYQKTPKSDENVYTTKSATSRSADWSTTADSTYDHGDVKAQTGTLREAPTPRNFLGSWHVPDVPMRLSSVFSSGNASRPTSQTWMSDDIEKR